MERNISKRCCCTNASCGHTKDCGLRTIEPPTSARERIASDGYYEQFLHFCVNCVIQLGIDDPESQKGRHAYHLT